MNRALLAEFVGERFARIADVRRGLASRYGELVSALRLAGRPIPVADIWNAAITLDAGGSLLTFDRDFQRVAGLPSIVLDPSSWAEQSASQGNR